MSITTIDANGRVMIPLGIRFQLDLNEGDEFAIDELGDGTIILKKIDSQIRFHNWLDNGADKESSSCDGAQISSESSHRFQS
jgi:AbrB family looped-hinge helix DNA binding protein